MPADTRSFEITSELLRTIGRIADDAGVATYLVGGYVRDTVMGREVKDADISVDGDGIGFARLVHRRLNTSVPVEFEAFGTARLIAEGMELEFVGMRKEAYNRDSRKPRVSRGGIEDDLKRRDFTVNAMAVRLDSSGGGVIIDPLGGLHDIHERTLRTPGDPEETFSEDPLRMARACRFAAQLLFRPDEAALEAVRRMADRIGIVSTERVRDELLKILASRKPSVGFILLHETGLLPHVFPELSLLAGVDQRSIEYPDGVRNFHHKDVFFHTLKVVDNTARVSDDLWLRLSALLHDIAKPQTKSFSEESGWTFHGHAEIGSRRVKKIFRALRLPMEHMRFVEKLVALHLRPIALVNDGVTDSAIRRLLFEAGEDIDALLTLCRADITSKNPKLVQQYLRNYENLIRKMNEVEERDRLRNWQPPLRGDEIMALCGIPSGIEVGLLKQKVEDAILDGLIENRREEAVEYLLSIKDRVLNAPSPVKPRSRRSMMERLPERLKE